MTRLKTILTSAAMAVALPMAAPAAAQMEIYENWEPAESVTELTFVKIDEGQAETYLEGLKSTWVAANKIQKEQGVISSYSIYMVPYKEEYNMILRITFPSGDMLQPNKERYMKFLEAYGKANIEQGNKTVLELYNKIRKIQSVTVMREVKFIGD
ncbi:MAG: hypothetical protein AAGE37_00115 [Pseudomonadota bacterium]